MEKGREIILNYTSEHQIDEILNFENIYCPSCSLLINRYDQIWNCKSCFSSFHLDCLKIKQTKIGNSNIFEWSCTECDDNYSQNFKPSYICFCGNYYENKKFNIDFNNSLYPHSCGCRCDFVIENNKKCSLPCHRGPHLYLGYDNKFFKKNNSNKEDNIKPRKNKNSTLNDYFTLEGKENESFVSKKNKIINLKGKIHVYGPKCDYVENVIYCGRKIYLGGWKLDQSIWANPFKVSEYKSNDVVCEKYEEYLRGDKKLLDELPNLIGKKLACWCYPNACHTEVILKLMKERNLK